MKRRSFLAGTADWVSTVTAIQTQTRQFAKRQLTWFRSLQCTAVPAGDVEVVERALLSPPPTNT